MLFVLIFNDYIINVNFTTLSIFNVFINSKPHLGPKLDNKIIEDYEKCYKYSFLGIKF